MKAERIKKIKEEPFCTITFTETEAQAFFAIMGRACVRDIEDACGRRDGSIGKLMSTENYNILVDIMED